MTRKLLLATTAIACLFMAGCSKEQTSGQTTSSQTTTTADGTSTTSTTTGPASDNSFTPAPQPDTAANDTSSSSDTQTASNMAPTATDSSAMLPTVADSDLADANSAQGFVQRAALSDQFEIAASRLALTKDVSSDVKSFAQMMIDAHTTTSGKLKTLADSHSLVVPTGLSQQEQDWLDALKAATTTAQFATLYTGQQVKAHTAALKLMNDYASTGDQADLKQFASATAPKVQEHLTKAEALAKAQPAGNAS